MTNYGPYTAQVVDIHDGDTISLDIDLGFGFFAKAHSFSGHPIISCRLYGINAPELSTPEGLQSRDYLRTLISPGDMVSVVSHGWDKYGGRFDGTVTLQSGVVLNEIMVDSGHAVVQNY